MDGWVKFAFLGILFSAIVKYFFYSEVVQPKAFNLPRPPKLVSALAPNERLANAKKTFEGLLKGPECLQINEEKGLLYTGLADGQVVELNLKTHDIRTLASTLGTQTFTGPESEPLSGRPLGLHLSGDELIVIESYSGIFTINIQTKEKKQILNSKDMVIEGSPLQFLNALLPLSNGSLLFTSSSTRNQRKDFFKEVVEASGTGRVLRLDPDGSVNVVIRNLDFANGLTFTSDRSAILVCETTKARILRYELLGPDAGKISIFADNLPAFPDNVVLIDDMYWVGTTGIRHADMLIVITDLLAPQPTIRMVLFKLFGTWMQKFVPEYGLVLCFDESGAIVQSMHDPSGRVSRISELQRYDGRLYMGSYLNDYIAVVPADGN